MGGVGVGCFTLICQPRLVAVVEGRRLSGGGVPRIAADNRVQKEPISVAAKGDGAFLQRD